MAILPFTNFTKGEIGPELQSRIDTSQYEAGAKKVRNFIIQKYGGLSFRPGFRFIASADNTVDNIRYIPFQFNIEQAYVLALGDFSMRLLANGGVILEDDLNIISITKGQTTTIEAAYHGYSVGERIYIDGITGMTELNKRFVKVLTVPDASHFTIDVDSTTFSNFVSSSGITRTGPPDPPPTVTPLPPPTTPTPPPTGTGGGSGAGTGGFHNRFEI